MSREKAGEELWKNRVRKWCDFYHLSDLELIEERRTIDRLDIWISRRAVMQRH